MDEVSGIGAKLMATKIKASVEGVEKGLQSAEIGKNTPLEGMREFEIKMEEANHAFALMTEIREKIEAAYHKLTPEN